VPSNLDYASGFQLNARSPIPNSLLFKASSRRASPQKPVLTGVEAYSAALAGPREEKVPQHSKGRAHLSTTP
jgi:hypothetical protein